MLEGILDLLFWAIGKGGYGALAGAIGGAIIALGVMFVPTFLETGAFCEGERACDDLLGWVAMIAIFAGILGAILGSLFGFVGKKIAIRAFGPFEENKGAIIGGLIGGAAPWLVLWILYLISSDQ